ncbi:hypothetical protein M378DRAFT_161971 [Amanita muscaria Koide BX008]|uniref:Secreted protein n=1 Tax=Amanita muscaria (strain Koide BX008) TaxID=946122 RepID=A0A0C2XA51_AMAMK|nr:hypothetical protein M378DRAFT_161971 [Amanita muscaria Koide BX008]
MGPIFFLALVHILRSFSCGGSLNEFCFFELTGIFIVDSLTTCGAGSRLEDLVCTRKFLRLQSLRIPACPKLL